MTALDWTRTSFGPPETWPQSLRTIVSVCLASRFPMLIWWGRDLSVLYNDAYIPIFASKHPWVLGRTGHEAWGEVWDVIGPMFDRVMKGGEATWSNDQLLLLARRGFVEEAYFTWSYSPIVDESGGVGGVFTAVIETTDRVLGERRLRTLRDLGEQAAHAKTPAGALEAAAQTMANNPGDIPFALLYLVDDQGTSARLTATAALPSGHPCCAPEVPLRESAPSLWPIADVIATGTHVVVDLAGRWDDLPGGLWDQPPRQAVCLPIKAAGQHRPHGALVAGLSPRLDFDDAYQGFLSLAASHIAGAVANAHAYQEERRRAEALSALDRAKTTFFSNVSHELRTPLTLMQAPVEDMLRAATTPEEMREPLSLVHRNALRLSKLVNTLLDFSRIEAGRMQPVFEPTDLADHTGRLASVFRSATDGAGLELRIDCPPLGELVYVDREMWEKVVLNLVSNAFKFTFEGGIYVSLRRHGSAAELTVRDTGTGIPPEELPRIFDRFHRVAGARGRTHEGTGIGLALVHELVKLHGGSVSVVSTPGQGTTFTVSVPLGTAHLPADAPARAPREGVPASTAFVEDALRWLPDRAASDDVVPADGAASPDAVARPAVVPGRVLVVDDNADMREYLRRLLAPHWMVEAVANGREALLSVAARRPDIVVTDVMMPELDGFGLLMALRDDAATRHVPVIMLSARAGEEARVEGLQAGADDYLVKPFSSRELVARVETQLLRARMRAVEEASRDRLTSVLRQAPAAIAILRGPDHVFELANPAYMQLVNHRDVLGKPARDAFPEVHSQGILDLLDQVYRTRQPYLGHSMPVMINRTSEGPLELRYFDFVFQPMFDADGAVEGVAAVAYEVTALAKAREEAEVASRAKDEFLAMLGHELRNPLAPILTALQLLRLRGLDAAERERLVIERQVRHLVGLVDDLLDVSRITRGKIQLRRRTLDIAEVIGKAVETASPLLEQQRHVLGVEVHAGELFVDGDGERLAQVVANLLTNAAKYTEPQGRITVRAERRGDAAAVVVTDTGIGLDPDMLPHIFDSFVQAPQAADRARGGLGLGLTIVRSLVALHGGTVSAHSAGRGHGSTFTVSLPLVARPASHTAGEPAGTQPASGAAQCRRRVLVVDDNHDAAAMLAAALDAFGHDVRTAHDGPSALQVAAAWRPEVAVLDIGLPVMDGYEVARRLAQQPALDGIRLVAVTGYGQQRDRTKTADAGFEAHLVKPVDIHALHALIDDAPSQRNDRSAEGVTR